MSLSSQENSLIVNVGDRFLSQNSTNTGLIGPIANNDFTTTSVGAPVIINILSNDNDLANLDANSIDLEPNELNIQNTAVVPEGIFSVDTVGQVVFTPNESFNTASVAIANYVVSDLTGLTSNLASITVNAVDSGNNQPAPILANDSANTTVNQPVNLDISANDTGEITAFDLDLIEPGIQSDTGTPEGNFIVNDQGNLVFTPVNNFTGTALLFYNVVDSIGQTAANPANITITVNDQLISPTPTPTPTPTPIPPGGNGNFTHPPAPVLNPLSILNITIPTSGNLNGDETGEIIYAEGANDTILGNGGNDTLIAYPEANPSLIANTWLVGGTDDDLLFGSIGNDTLIAEAGNNIILANSGNDFLQGGIGNNTLAGETGDDWIIAIDGNNLIYGQVGDDTIQTGNQNDSISGDVGNDWLQSGPGNDWVFGDFANDTIFGQVGDDTLLGDNNSGANLEENTPDEDLLFAGAGKDLSLGHQGNDTLLGEADNDTLWGGKDDDLLFGDNDIDTLSGNDLLIGGVGNDTVVGNGGDDTIYGDNTDSSLADMNDLLIGGVGNDLIHGNNGRDSLAGDAGNDSLFGGKGDDILSGGLGNDFIITGIGSDLIYLGINQGVDIITDFQSGVDHLILEDTLTIGQLQFSGRDGATVIIDRNNNQELAILQNVSPENSANFFY